MGYRPMGLDELMMRRFTLYGFLCFDIGRFGLCHFFRMRWFDPGR